MKLVCKKCGNEKYFYTKDRIVGSVRTIFTSDGEYAMDGINQGMYNNLERHQGSIFYCLKCGKFVADRREDE